MATTLFTDAQILIVFTKRSSKFQTIMFQKNSSIFDLKIFLKNGKIRNKPNRGNPSFTLNDVTIEIPIHEDSYSVSHVETPSTEYNLQTPNNSPIASTIPETQELITNMVNDFSFTEVTSPEDELQVYPISEHIVFHLQSPTILENELFLDNMEKEAKFVNFKNNIISDLLGTKTK